MTAAPTALDRVTTFAEEHGWVATRHESIIAGLTRVTIDNPTHCIFTWWTVGDEIFHSAQLYADREFEPRLSTTCESHLVAWVACHALEAAS